VRTIVITIEAPDDVEVRVVQSSAVPDDFEHEPLPPFQGTEEHFDDIGQTPGPIPEQPPMQIPARRGIAVAQPAPFAWQEGMKHDPSHKALKAGQRGLYCPTKIGRGPQGDVWCQWRAS
jgi:hypothetical protein